MIIENKPSFTQLYFITITLRPIMYKVEPRQQYEMLLNILDRTFKGYEYLIIPELTMSYNIHFHGVIRSNIGFNDYKKKPFDYYIHKLVRSNHKFIGFIKVEPVIDYNKVMCYILKEIEKTYNVLDIELFSESFGPHLVEDELNIELNNIGFDIHDYRYFKMLSEKIANEKATDLC